MMIMKRMSIEFEGKVHLKIPSSPLKDPHQMESISMTKNNKRIDK